MAKRPWLNCILVLGLTVSLSACDQPAAPPDLSVSQPDVSQSEPADTLPLTLAIYENQSLHPILSNDRVNLTLAPLIYEALFQLDPSFTPHKQLCEQFTRDDTGLIWTITLRRDAVFSDGTPLTAAHVVRSLELARSPASRYAGRFSSVSAISAVGDYELTITLSRPNTALSALLDIPIVLGDGPRPLGTGPYALTQGEDNELSLVPRSGASATIPLTTVTRTRELTAAFERGDLSVICTDPSGTDSPAYSGTYRTVDYDTTSLVYLGFNTGRSSFSSASDRTAAAAALDRGSLVSAAWSGHAQPTTLPFHPASPLYDESIARQFPTPDTAQDLISRSKLSSRAFTLIVNTENSSRVSAAHLIARQLEQAGVNVNVSPLPWADYLSALSKGLFDLYLGEVALTADFDLTDLISSGGTLNYSRWRSTRADELLRVFLSVPEQARPQAASQLSSYLAEQMPIVPLCFKRGCVLTQWDRWSELTPTQANAFFGLE